MVGLRIWVCLVAVSIKTATAPEDINVIACTSCEAITKRDERHKT